MLANLKSHIVASSWGGPRRVKSYAFTKQGVATLSSVLRNKCAAQINIEIIDAFFRLRQMLPAYSKLERKLSVLEKKYDKQLKIAFDAIQDLCHRRR